MNKPIVVNLYGGPGSGKSTVAAKVFAKLKEQNVNVELITEYAKDLTWQESFNVLKNQIYVFAKQHHRLWRVRDKVDVIVTDSPLLISLVYGAKYGNTFKKFVQEEYNLYNNLNVLLRRPEYYQSHGRTQTYEQAVEIDASVRNVVWDNGYSFDLNLEADTMAADIILAHIIPIL
jgi:nicotinamide riboside kinase